MPQILDKTQITLDPKADHNLDKSTTSGEVWIYINRMENGQMVDKSIEFYFETDSDHDVTLLSMGDVLEDPNGAQNDSTYELNDSDEFEIQILIKKWIESQLEDESSEDYYDGYAEHGMRNSDFLYGYYA